MFLTRNLVLRFYCLLSLGIWFSFQIGSNFPMTESNTLFLFVVLHTARLEMNGSWCISVPNESIFSLFSRRRLAVNSHNYKRYESMYTSSIVLIWRLSIRGVAIRWKRIWNISYFTIVATIYHLRDPNGRLWIWTSPLAVDHCAVCFVLAHSVMKRSIITKLWSFHTPNRYHSHFLFAIIYQRVRGLIRFSQFKIAESGGLKPQTFHFLMNFIWLFPLTNLSDGAHTSSEQKVNRIDFIRITASK